MSFYFLSDYFFVNDGKVLFTEFFLFLGLLFCLGFGVVFSNSAAYRYPVLFFCVSRQIVFIFLFSSYLLNNQPFVDVFFFNSHFFFSKEDFFLKQCLLFFTACFAVLVSEYQIKTNKIQLFEYFILVGFSLLSLFLLVSANDALVFYLCLELHSFCLYILSSLQKDKISSTEAGLKYFLLGAISSGFLLLGMSLLYGFFGTTNFTAIRQLSSSFFFTQDVNFLPLIGFFFFMVGLLFKVGAVPFHVWIADVYTGIPFISLVFFSTVPKIALFFIITKFYFSFYTFFNFFLYSFFFAVIVLSVFVGSFGAFLQTDVRRFLAYSSINHTGVILLVLFSPCELAYNLLFFYLSMYCVMAFLLFSFLFHGYNAKVNYEKKQPVFFVQKTAITDLRGVHSFFPIFSFFFTVVFFSFSGIPPLAGFFTKVFLFFSVLSESHFYLVWFVFFSSLLPVLYYLRFVKILVFDKFVFGTNWSSFFVMNFVVSWLFILFFCVLFFFVFFPDFFFLLFY